MNQTTSVDVFHRVINGIAKLFLALLIIGSGMGRLCADPVILNSTETAAPGEVIYLQGEGFSSNPQIWFHRVLTTDTALTPDVQLTSTLSIAARCVTLTLPKNMPMGLYALWVKDSSGVLSAPVFINRARAMSFEYTEISPSYSFRIFGRNLFVSGATPSVTFVNGSNSYAATVDTTYANDGYVLKVTAPSGVVAGTVYSVKVSNGLGHNASANFDVTVGEQTILGRSGGADPFGLNVPWAPDYAAIAADVINVVTSNNPHTGAAYGADPTGSVNAFSIIQQALADAGTTSLHANGATVYLPAGTYKIDKGTTVSGLNLTAKVVLKGDGIDQTIINDVSPALSISRGLTIGNSTPADASLTGMKGFTYNQSMTVSATLGPPVVRNFSSGSNKVFFSDIKMNFAHGIFDTTNVQYGLFVPQGTSNTKVLVQNCSTYYARFGNNNLPATKTYGSEYIIRNNTISSFFARLELIYLGKMILEGNHFTRDGAFPYPDYYTTGSVTCGGLDATDPDAVILNNTFDSINLPISNHNDGEAILNQAMMSYYDFNQVSSATSTTVTDTTRAWTTNSYSGYMLAIIDGPGMGQLRKVVSNTATTATIDKAWTVVPTSASRYALTGGGAERWLVKGNNLYDQRRGIALYTGVYDCAVVDNFLQDVGETIYLRADQRSYNGTAWYGRANLLWRGVVVDNIALNTKGTWGINISAELYMTSGSTLAGTMVMGAEYRRNLLKAYSTNVYDGAILLNEGYNNACIDSNKTFTETGSPGILGSVFDDNVAIQTSNAFYLNSHTYLTTIWNQLNLSVPSDLSDTTLSGATHASVNTVWGGDAACFVANFSGTGSGTGATTDMVNAGGVGVIKAGTLSNSVTISSTSPFTSTSGAYVTCYRTTTGNSARVQVTPTTARTTWGRIFDFRSGQWLINGGVDFFWRPKQDVTLTNTMRPIDLSNSGTNYLRMTFYNKGSNGIISEIVTSSGGGGATATGTYSTAFLANQVYHLGMLFATDPVTGVTTQKLFCVAGTGAIDTSSTTVGTGGLIGISTFTLNPGIVSNTSGWLASDTWLFGDSLAISTDKTNDYDGLRLWAQDPGQFPEL